MKLMSTLPESRAAGYHLSALTLAIVVVLGAATMLPVFGQEKPKGSPVEQAVIKLENDWNDALVKHDLVALGRMFSDDLVFTDADGAMSTKAQLLDMLKSGEDVYTSALTSNMKVHVYGNTAIVTGIFTTKEQMKGKDISGTFAYTDTWVKLPGGWQCVATHDSRIAQK